MNETQTRLVICSLLFLLSAIAAGVWADSSIVFASVLNFGLGIFVATNPRE